MILCDDDYKRLALEFLYPYMKRRDEYDAMEKRLDDLRERVGSSAPAIGYTANGEAGLVGHGATKNYKATGDAMTSLVDDSQELDRLHDEVLLLSLDFTDALFACFEDTKDLRAVEFLRLKYIDQVPQNTFLYHTGMNRRTYNKLNHDALVKLGKWAVKNNLVSNEYQIN